MFTRRNSALMKRHAPCSRKRSPSLDTTPRLVQALARIRVHSSLPNGCEFDNMTTTTRLTESYIDASAPDRRELDRRMRRVQKIIKRAEHRLYRRYPILKYKDAIATVICFGSCIGMVAMGIAYVRGWAPWYVVIFVNSVLAGLLNEVEHDCIHHIYYRHTLWMKDLMMFLSWTFRGNYMSPWRRRLYHLHHHRTSGSREDLETQFIGLGKPYGVYRFLLHIDSLWGFVFAKKITGEVNLVYRQKTEAADNVRHMFPVTVPFFVLWISFLVLQMFHFAQFVLGTDVPLPGWLASYDAFLVPLAITWMIPCTIRTASLAIVSAHTHYSGEGLHPMQQGQVMDFWYMKPLQLFVFRFGVTHIMHHIVVLQPFFVRELLSGIGNAALVKYGVPHNDYGTVFRGNHHPSRHPAAETTFAQPA